MAGEPSQEPKRGQAFLAAYHAARAAQQKLQEMAAHPRWAPFWGFANQGRMELAHFFGKAFPETPQFDDPAAVFNRTPLEGYELKHGTEPSPAKDRELGKDADKDHELDR